MCKEFRLTSTAGIRQYRPELLGTYQLQHKLENKRIVYLNMDSRMYFFSATNGDEQFDGSWAVRLCISVLLLHYNKKKFLLTFSLIVNYFIFQIGIYPGDYDRIKAANPYCRNINLPANGECTYGWFFIPNDYGASPLSDLTVEIDCLGTYSYPV